MVHNKFDSSSKKVGLISNELEVKDNMKLISESADPRLSMTTNCKIIIRGSKKQIETENNHLEHHQKSGIKQVIFAPNMCQTRQDMQSLINEYQEQKIQNQKNTPEFSANNQPECNGFCPTPIKTTQETRLIDLNEPDPLQLPMKTDLNETISSILKLEMTFPISSQPPLKPITLSNITSNQPVQPTASIPQINKHHKEFQQPPIVLENNYERTQHPVVNHTYIKTEIGDHKVAKLHNETTQHNEEIIEPTALTKGIVSINPVFAVNLLHVTIRSQNTLAGLGYPSNGGVSCTSLSPRKAIWLAGNLTLAQLTKDMLLDNRFWFVNIQSVEVFENTSRIWHSRIEKCYCACVCTSTTCNDSHAFAVFMLDTLGGTDFKLFASVRDRLKESGLLFRAFLDGETSCFTICSIK
ncbi:hypothetical protein HK096_001697 [Nowakowskiella sp. JEL0078]|nr:hypothetical protein HK096_001697 [Nowakowskiella sp. JEL0078]